MRAWILLMVACLCLPASTALPGLQATLPSTEAGMAGAAVEAGPVAAGHALVLLPGAGIDNPTGLGPGRVASADAVFTLDVGGGVRASAFRYHADAPLPLLPDGVLYVGAGAVRDADAFGGRFAQNVVLLERELQHSLDRARIERAHGSAPAPSSAEGAPLLLSPAAPDAATGVASPDASTASGAEEVTAAQARLALERAGPTARQLAIAAGVGLGALALLGLALYSRIRPNATLDNDTRKALFDAVCAQPGQGVQELAAAASVSYSTATYHLDRLAGAGMIVMTPDGNKMRYYKNGGAFTAEERRLLPILKNNEAARVLACIVDEPGTYRTRIADALGVTTTTINWHLRRLAEAGLVTEERRGRSAHLYPSPVAAEVLRGLAEKLATEDDAAASLARRFAQVRSGAC